MNRDGGYHELAVWASATAKHQLQGFFMSRKTQKPAEVVLFIDQQQFKVDGDHGYTVRDLIKLAGEDPQETTLVLRKGNELLKLTNQDEVVELRNGLHFVIYHNTPTPVS